MEFQEHFHASLETLARYASGPLQMNAFNNSVLRIPILKTSSLGNVKEFVDKNRCTSLIRWEQVEYISGVYQEKILEQIIANERLKELESESKPVQVMQVD